uniref:KIB1-4 beta-propeller domain-containing protein n=1 Tax=Oryza meridionalis TaxID=40149 RepID=A0A0E0D5B1_9ORYZ
MIPAIYQLDELHNFIYMKAVTSSDPATGDFTVMLIHNPYMQLDHQTSNGIRSPSTTTFASPIASSTTASFYTITYHRVVHLIDVSPDSSYVRGVIVQETLPMMFVDYDLGDNDVFIGRNYIACLSTKDYPGLMPNHIYFTDDDECSLRAFKGTPRDIGVYNYEDDTLSEVVSPQPWLKWPPPIWITPSFKDFRNTCRQ